MPVIKNLSYEDAVRIISFYETYISLPYLPKILDYRIEKNNSQISFEEICGIEASEKDIQIAFYSLGKMHLLCRQAEF